MENNQKGFSLKVLVEGGMLAAICVILSQFVKITLMPNGGSVSLGGMLPIFIFAYRRGWTKGVFMGIVCALVTFLIGEKYSFHPVSVLCDYVLPFAIMGLLPLFGRSIPKCMIGILAISAVRFISHTISGTVVFATPWVGSMVYNATYVIPETIILMVLMAILIKPFQNHGILPTPGKNALFM